jgi:coenzyme F420 hydrogenase subunit beta
VLEERQIAGPADPVPNRKLCTDCGLSRTNDPKRCGQACQFIQPDYPGLEQRVHGRQRQQNTTQTDELFFGPYQQILSARMDPPTQGAQWTGITTRLAEVLLEKGLVDAVIAMAADPNDRWRPRPVVVTRAQDMQQCRGMRMGYAPLLSLVEPALAQGHKRLAVIGIPCQIYALRAIQPQLEREQGLEQLYVIGTPCSDNTTTENFHQFLGLISDRPQDISYVEFRADYKVEVRTDQGGKRLIPFLNLPLSTLPPDFFPLTCRTCVDYTNVLSDITVGYMG